MGILDQVKELGKDLVPESQAIRGKMESIRQYKDATPYTPASPAPAPSAPAKKYDPKNHYGSRPGEKRLDSEGNEMKSYKKGTDYVPETGPAILHEGEAVIPKEKNKMKDNGFDAVKDALGGVDKSKKPKKEIKHLVHKRSKNGGHIIEHHHTAPEHHPMEEHTFDNHDDMLNHVMEHMTDKNEGEDDSYREPDMGDANEAQEGEVNG